MRLRKFFNNENFPIYGSWNLQSNGENPFEYKVECLLQISFKVFEFAFECFE